MKTGKVAAMVCISFAAAASGVAAFYYVCKNNPSFKQKADIAAEKAVKKFSDSVR